MEIKDAIKALNGLAQDSRLLIFRLLVKQGESGMTAGNIAKNLSCPANTLSNHLGILCRAGLIQSRREGRSIIYSINRLGIRRLLTYLMHDCCRGNPELCLPIPKPTQKKKG